MTTTTLSRNKPFFTRGQLTAAGKSLAGRLAWLKLVNWAWWLQRLPMALLAGVSAYGVGAFADNQLPLGVAILAGFAFEATYMGCVALADQQHNDRDWKTTLLWWLVNLVAVGAATLSNLLFFSGGHYSGVTAETATHAVPLAVLNFFYGLLVHRIGTQGASASHQVAVSQAHSCPCGWSPAPGHRNPAAALNGHQRHCKTSQAPVGP